MLELFVGQSDIPRSQGTPGIFQQGFEFRIGNQLFKDTFPQLFPAAENQLPPFRQGVAFEELGEGDSRGFRAVTAPFEEVRHLFFPFRAGQRSHGALHGVLRTQPESRFHQFHGGERADANLESVRD
ncbi:hypothetical protein SDC9_207693 [bioreactor metagenome]|uniref:Uncharacterized protein n=1 Tax=bioreactor metagenome TaxID=1076179 RepID=A0A645J9Z1_9ZZZZ